jgi:hypothetical protein
VRSCVLKLPYAVVRPYSTSESLGAFVVHEIVAPNRVISEANTAEMTGGATVGSVLKLQIGPAVVPRSFFATICQKYLVRARWRAARTCVDVHDERVRRHIHPRMLYGCDVRAADGQEDAQRSERPAHDLPPFGTICLICSALDASAFSTRLNSRAEWEALAN